MANIFKQRIQSVRKKLPDRQIDALLVQIEENRRYLSGFTGEDGGYDESAGVLLITADDLILATDSRYTLQAENECPDYKVFTYKKGLSRELPGIVRDLGIRRLGFEVRRMSCEQFELIHKHLKEEDVTVDLAGTKDIVEELRIIKDEAEIEAMRKAVGIAENALSELLNYLSPDMSEIDAAWAIEKSMRQSGAQSVSFPVIVAAGKNAALPHAIPGNRAIQKGEPVLFDWGAKLDGYCSDTSRTILLGRPDTQFERIFNAVYDAQQKAIAAIRPGAFTGDIDAIARETLKEKELDAYFGHGLGHGVGLAIHEQPSLSPVPERNVEIKEGMVFTVEPGVYISDWGGIRLENMVVVRKEGPEILNQLNVRM